MSVSVQLQRGASAYNSATQTDTDSMILRKYYREQEFLTSPEAIMKVLSVIVCIVSSVLLLSGAACGGAALAAGGAALALGAAAALAALYAAAAFALPALAPVPCFFADLIISTVIGILLLVNAVTLMTLCDMEYVIDYVHGPLAVINACLVTGSAVASYVSVTRRWDRARGPSVEPRRPPPSELDV